MASNAPPSQEMQRIVSLAMDAGFYRAARPGAEAADGLVADYLVEGWRQGCDPAPWFSVEGYLEANPDVRAAGVEPFHHYLTQGRHEGREAPASATGLRHQLGPVAAGWDFAPSRLLTPAERRARRRTPQDLADERASIADAFDALFYLAANPDIAAAGADALDHFLRSGWIEGRNPTARFSVGDYLTMYPDVAAAGMNPFVHYIRTGQAEGRRPLSDLGFRHDILASLVPVDRRIAAAKARAAATPVADQARLDAAFASARFGLRDLHLTFSHDDHTAHIGGVQLCLRREGLGFARLGFDHLHIHPATPWPVMREAGETAPMGVVLNGLPVGVFSADTILAALTAAAPETGRRTLAIHSLLGHAPGEVVNLARALGVTEGWFWLHDFASLCAGYHLMRDDVADCGAPPAGSAACGVCAYGPHRARHVEGHRVLFEGLSLTVASPSEATLALWRRAGDLPAAGVVVEPHATLNQNGPAPLPAPDAPFRLAFAGLPQAHKGWPVFRALALRFEDDQRYAFTHLGARTEGGLPVDFASVMVAEDPTAVGTNAMQAGLAESLADAVLIWPLCRETFSFTAYEAVAAGAAVITNIDSGNVAAFTAEGEHGVVLADESALIAAFESGEILALARRARQPAAYDLAFGALTADLAARRSLAQ
ncbi:hypothetical protein [Phenylobacterium immobile]|uniref:hypothetical protein n=1 Tax=Phenylobacterium immobile TaxID=21 RepID=UPI000AEBF561|nr:hypothetical protein [Phenylobacterium immobile]